MKTILLLIPLLAIAGCAAPTGKDTAHKAGSHEATQEPGEIKPVKVGKYQVELWPPEDGVYSGEAVDVEFAVFDTTKKEPEMGGMLGVADLKAEAVVTMPAMAGMPEQKPKIHKEGQQGVSGLELFFPHGGDYQIDLTISPQGEEPFKATFTLPVKDERPKVAKKAPYELKIVDFPSDAKSGVPVELKMQILDTETGKPETKFDLAHEQRFHLLIASKDLSRFSHEHPSMSADGTWTYTATFPTGGDYWIYGDVAPTGKGSRILAAKVAVEGEGTNVPIKLDLGPSIDGDLTGALQPAGASIPIGKSTDFTLTLTDSATGKPASDIEPWLGAAGHLMIIHQDGTTVVHSHPHEAEHSGHSAAEGKIMFGARFPKAGLYKAYAQVKRGGKVRTMGFGLEVK